MLVKRGQFDIVTEVELVLIVDTTIPSIERRGNTLKMRG